MRRFSAEYLSETRRGMWTDSRVALDDLELGTRSRVLDVGCGTGEFTRVLAEETNADVVGVDADESLLAVAQGAGSDVVAGDAIRLPFPDDTFDLVVCQALLINLPSPRRAAREFARVSSDLVAAVEPDNGAVTVESSVDAEEQLARQARDAYLTGVETNVELGGSGTRAVFHDAGLMDVNTREHVHEARVEPPYSEHALEAAQRKANGAGLARRRDTMLAGDFTREEYDDLRGAWRQMGRDVIEQMRGGTYRRTETIPLYVTVGSV